ncbi:MAG: DMT family transporter [Candidatus Peribacteraceae bacterium]|jgi:drug/metabolite transporter (DMT)-like permease|nr:DMT family transporter [Candidatus Peribacteraceae bacterium]
MQTLTGVLRQPAIHVRRHLCPATIGWIALTVMILSGSTTTVFGKKLTEFFSPLSMLFLSEVMLLLFAVLTFGFFPIIKKIRRVHPAVILPLLTAGVLNGVVAPVFWFTGLERTFAVNSQLFSNAETLFLILFGMLLMHSFPKRTQWFGGIIIFAGLLTVALHGFTEKISMADGDILIILAGCFYGLGGAFIRKYLRTIEPQIIIVTRSCCAIAFFFLLAPFLTHSFASELTSFPLEFLGVLIGYGLISRFLLIFSFYESIERLPLPTVSLLGTVTVGTGLLFAHWFLGESIVWYQSTGAALIILGAMVVQWGSLRKLEENVAHYLQSHHHH